MIRMKTPRIGHDHEIEIGPPLLKPAPKLVKQPARMEMIENEIAKFENPDHDRLRSCLYPRLGEVRFVLVVDLWLMRVDLFVSFGHETPSRPDRANVNRTLDPSRSGCKCPWAKMV